MKVDIKKVVIGAMAFLALPAAASAQDAKKGEIIFRQCMACHSLEAGKNKIGPSLHAIVGRQAGTIEGFAYSDAMKNSGLTWDESNLTQYLLAPKSLVPGTKMAFAGIKDEVKRGDLIAYLKQATQ